MLEWVVTPGTLKRYKDCVIKFLQWTQDNQEDAQDENELDDVLLDYVHHLYESDAGKTAASHTLFGICLYLPALKYQLPKTRQAVKGWNKNQPGRSYPPITWELAQLVAVHLRHSKRRNADRHAVGVLLSFDCLLRIGELVSLRHEDVADTGDGRIGAEHKGMVLRLRRTKTGPNQDCRVQDPVVVKLVRDLVRRTKPGDRLFPFLAATFRKHFKDACADLRLSPLYVPHSLRHGGATRYRHVLKWSIEDVMERGRWVSSKSARRYVQSGVAMLLAMSVPPDIGKLALDVSGDLELLMTLPQRH